MVLFFFSTFRVSYCCSATGLCRKAGGIAPVSNPERASASKPEPQQVGTCKRQRISEPENCHKPEDQQDYSPRCLRRDFDIGNSPFRLTSRKEDRLLWRSGRECPWPNQLCLWPVEMLRSGWWLEQLPSPVCWQSQLESSPWPRRVRLPGRWCHWPNAHSCCHRQRDKRVYPADSAIPDAPNRRPPALSV